MKISIVIAEDHHLIRQALTNLLSTEASLTVVAEVDNGRDAVDTARQQQPDILLIDLVMPQLNGVDAIRSITRQRLATRCLALSSSVESRTVLHVMEAGAWGYVSKNVIYSQLVDAIHAVMSGQKWLSPSVTDGVVQHCLDGGSRQTEGRSNGNGRHGSAEGGAESSAMLTPREREVLQLLSEGKASKQIATALHLSVKTIDSHRASLMQKLELHSVADLTKYAVREGITPLSC
jgi:DNA-binding NarL/FixJ family response regulator